MKNLLLPLLVLIYSSLFGQPAKNQAKVLKNDDGLGIQIIKTIHDSKTEYHLISNKTDSILFYSLNYRLADSLIYEGINIEKPIQLDGIGKEEIKFCFIFNDYKKGGEYTKTIFILNLDSKQKIFEGRWDYNKPDQNIAYTYTITFDEEKNLIIDHNKYHCNMDPDQEEGIYSIVNGKYKWIKSKYKYSRKTIIKNDSLGVEVIQISRCENALSKHFLFFNHGTDSIFFHLSYSCIENMEWGSKEEYNITALQLDDNGKPEIIMEKSDYSPGGRHSSSMIIFNLDTKKVIFWGDRRFFSMYVGEEIADCKGYASDIQIMDSKNIEVIHDPNNCTEPSLKEGIYSIQNGMYTWIKNK